jgi:hypothetical protein
MNINFTFKNKEYIDIYINNALVFSNFRISTRTGYITPFNANMTNELKEIVGVNKARIVLNALLCSTDNN